MTNLAAPIGFARPLVVLGHRQQAVHSTLRRMLRRSQPEQLQIIIDYQGVASHLLGPRNHGRLWQRQVTWIDVARRAYPVGFFRLHAGYLSNATTQRCMAQFLERTVKQSPVSLGSEDVQWLIEVLHSLSQSGVVTLESLFRSFSHRELTEWYRGKLGREGNYEEVIRLLEWLLRFPSVYAASQGNNIVDIESLLIPGNTLWFEIQADHFERHEYHIVTGMIETMLQLALHSAMKSHQPNTLLIHMLPAEMPLTLQTAVRLPRIKPVMVFGTAPGRNLSKATKNSLQYKPDLWLVGPFRKVNEQTKEILRKHCGGDFPPLKHGQLLVQQHGNKPWLTMKVHTADERSAKNKARRAARTGATLSPVAQAAARVSELQSNGEQRTQQLYKQLANPENLHAAWYRMAKPSNRSVGIDGVTIEFFRQNLESEIAKLSEEIGSFNYKCRPLRRLYITKPNGELRPLAILCLRDRLVQIAALTILERIYEPTFSPYSFGFRPKRGAQHAITVCKNLIHTGHKWVARTDIRKCFDSLDHSILLDRLSLRIGDYDFLELIQSWLQASIIDFHGLSPVELGAPQGEPISPILANIYLDALDNYLASEGIRFVRYADDTALFFRSQEVAETGHTLMADFLTNAMNLQLNHQKTGLYQVDEGFDFLGFTIHSKGVQVEQTRLEAAFENIDKRLDHLASFEDNLPDEIVAMENFNAFVRGFRNYFLFEVNEVLMGQLLRLDTHVDQQAKKLLNERLLTNYGWLARERFSIVPQEHLEHPATSPTGYPARDSGPNVEAPTLKQAEATQAPAASSESAKDSYEEESDEVYRFERSLFVPCDRAYARFRKGSILVERKGQTILAAPPDELDMVHFSGRNVSLSAQFIQQASQEQITILISQRLDLAPAVVQSIRTGSASLRQAQVIRRNDPQIVAAGLDMLVAKITNQAAVLKYFMKYRKRLDGEIAAKIQSNAAAMVELAQPLKALSGDAKEIRQRAMGYEGRAAALYWSSIKEMLPETVEFSGRVTHMAEDPVNQSLNYVYSMLYSEIWRALTAAGLDPYFGILHGRERDAGSLVFDLIEEFRAPFADRIVLALIGRKFIPKHSKSNRLDRKSKRILINAAGKYWYKRRTGKSTEARIAVLTSQARSLAHSFSKGEPYKAYRFKW